LQQRGRCHEGFEEAWSAELADFARASQAKALIVLSGAQAFLGSDDALNSTSGPQVRPLLFLPGADTLAASSAAACESEGDGSLLSACTAVFGSAFRGIATPAPCDASKNIDELQAILQGAFSDLQGCGLTARHARQCCLAGIPVLTISICLNEGLNAPEAVILAHLAQLLVGLFRGAGGVPVHPAKVSWQEPPSWVMPEGPAPPARFLL
jgi:hypothetical protein